MISSTHPSSATSVKVVGPAAFVAEALDATLPDPSPHKDTRLASQYYCGNGTLLGYDETDAHVIVVPVRCKSWDCERCGPAKRAYWIDFLRRGHPERELTLTCPTDKFDNAVDTVLRMKKAFTLLVQKIRRHFGKFEYALVWELTHRGVPHAHILFRGTYIPKKWLSLRWTELGFGPVVWIQRVTAGSLHAAHACKYLAKETGQSAAKLAPLRIVQHSRGYIIENEDLKDRPGDPAYVWMYSPLDPHEVLEEYCQSQRFAYLEESADGSTHVFLIKDAPEDPMHEVASGQFCMELLRAPP